MKSIVVCLFLTAIVPATAALSETCVSDTFERPLPDATDIEIRHADVPSPRFPGIWQEGWIDGFFYRFWSSKEAVLQSNRKSPSWRIKVICDGGGIACEKTIEGDPTAVALSAAEDLGGCLSDANFSGGNAPDDATTEAVTPTPDNLTETNDQAPQLPCGLAAVPEGSTGLTLQRLLVQAGGDPGSLDGLVGPKTFQALVDVLGAPAQQLNQSEAIRALDHFLCDPSRQSNN